MSSDDFPSLASKPKTADEAVYVPAFVPLTAETLNLETELLDQYNAAKKLYHDASYDEKIPLNQKAQALNTISSVVATLIRSQQELYSTERVKKIESSLIATLRAFPDVQAVFMVAYEKALND